MTARLPPHPATRRLDRRAKRVCLGVLESEGVIETEREVDPEVRRVDVWFVPDPACAANLGRLGLLGRMCAQPTAIEAYSQAPDCNDVRDCAFKQLGLLHLERGNHPELPDPWMWVICAGRPSEGLIASRCEPARGFAPGVYLAPPLFRLGIVVISELPTSRDTLLVRLLGRGQAFEQAMKELEELPLDAPERQKVLPVMRRYYMDTGTTGAGGRVGEDEEDWRIMMDFFEELRAEGRSQGLEQGLEKGLIAAFAARFGPMPADLRALIHKRQDKRVLHECFAFIGASSAAEACAGLRARLHAPTTTKTPARRVRAHPASPQGAR